MATGFVPGELRIEPLGNEHDREPFSCGVLELDTYLRGRAGQDVASHTASAFVLLGRSSRVLGYYTLLQLSISLADLPADTARKLPRHPLAPATLIGRLAVDEASQRLGLGSFLLVDALERSWRAAQQVASYAVRVDAADERARRFYLRHDFVSFPGETLKLYIPMATLDKLFSPEKRGAPTPW